MDECQDCGSTELIKACGKIICGECRQMYEITENKKVIDQECKCGSAWFGFIRDGSGRAKCMECGEMWYPKYKTEIEISKFTINT